MSKPRNLADDEWNKVIEIASTDQQVIVQNKSNNVGELEHYWVGYVGGPGVYVETDSNIISGKVNP